MDEAVERARTAFAVLVGRAGNAVPLAESAFSVSCSMRGTIARRSTSFRGWLRFVRDMVARLN
ncbi:MAG: hypothetical protein GEU73_02305 [Chloroflexi bacterium]|nr:hypothetical protein [Chloroflexota bacterium]